MAKDEADHASEQEAYNTAEAIWRARKPSRLQNRGICYYCADSCPGQLFCDVECRRDYEHEQEVLRKTRPTLHLNKKQEKPNAD